MRLGRSLGRPAFGISATATRRPTGGGRCSRGRRQARRDGSTGSIEPRRLEGREGPKVGGGRRCAPGAHGGGRASLATNCVRATAARPPLPQLRCVPSSLALTAGSGQKRRPALPRDAGFCCHAPGAAPGRGVATEWPRQRRSANRGGNHVHDRVCGPRVACVGRPLDRPALRSLRTSRLRGSHIRSP